MKERERMRKMLSIILIISALSPLASLRASETVKASKVCAAQSASIAGLPAIPLAERFQQPPNSYRMFLYSGSDLDDKKCKKVADYGFGGVQVHVGRDTKPWFKSDTAWQRFGSMVDIVRNHGLRVWLHDDVGYPSGSAGGNVVTENPAYESRSLMSVVQTGEGTMPVRLELPKDIPNVEKFVYAVLYPLNAFGKADIEKGHAIPVLDDRVETMGMNGKWLLSAFARKISGRFVVNKYWNDTGRWPNLLEPAATDRWLALVHDQFAQQVPDFAKKVDAFYTNEPCFDFLDWKGDAKQEIFFQVPWVDDFPEVFQRQHGYDLIPYLQALVAGDDDASKLVRLHYFQTRADLIATRYFKKIAERCRKYGVKSSGHLLLEEYLSMHVLANGDYLKAISNEDIPACDIPIPDADQEFEHYWMPKYVSSAAYLHNGRETAALLDPIIGRGGRASMLKPSPELFRRTINLAYLCGINQILTYGKWLEFTPEECIPYNEYVGRLTVMLRGAANAAQVAVYYPIETVQANIKISTRCWPKIISAKADAPYQAVDQMVDLVARGLLEHRLDFNFLNADAILAADMTNGYLVAGEHKYSTIIMPAVEVISLAVLRKLDAFSRKGGTVLWAGRLPRLGVTAAEHAAVQAIAARMTVVAEPWTRVAKPYDPRFQLQLKADAGLLSARYQREDGLLYYLVNTLGNKKLVVNVSGPIGRKVRICNPNNGTITEVSVPAEITIDSFNSVFLLD